MINNRRLIPLTVLTVFYTIIPFFLITQCNKLAQARIVDREINTAESFFYVDSFCFNTQEEQTTSNENNTHGAVRHDGIFKVEMTYSRNVSYGLVFYKYFNTTAMWELFNEQSNCLSRIAKSSNNYFSTSSFITEPVTALKDGKYRKDGQYIKATQDFEFKLSRPTWFLIVLTNCDWKEEYFKWEQQDLDAIVSNSNQGSIHTDFRLTMLNGNGPFRHFSYNEFDDLPIATVFFLVYIILFGIYVVISTCLSKKTTSNGSDSPSSINHAVNNNCGYRLLSQHKTVNFLGFSILLKLIGNFIDLVRLKDYSTIETASGHEGNGGIQDLNFYTAEMIGLVFHHMSDVVFVLDIMLIAKGWTVIRRKISAKGRIKLAIVMTLYWCAGMYAVIIYSEGGFFHGIDRIENTSYYTGRSGAFLVWTRFGILAWFMFSAYTTFTKPSFKRKRKFYKIYFTLGLLYLLIIPVIAVLSTNFGVGSRKKWVSWTSNIFITLGHMSFLYIFWPSNYNGYFPFAFETKEQEMARMDAFKRRSETLFNRQGGVTTSNSSGREDAGIFNGNDKSEVENGFGPQYNTTTTTNNNSTKNIRKRSSHRVSRASISGGSQNVSPRANITSLSQSLKSKIKVIYDYSEDLDEAISLFFDEEEDVNMHQKE